MMVMNQQTFFLHMNSINKIVFFVANAKKQSNNKKRTNIKNSLTGTSNGQFTIFYSSDQKQTKTEAY